MGRRETGISENETENIYGYRIHLPQEENETGEISGDYGRDHLIGRMGRGFGRNKDRAKASRPWLYPSQIHSSRQRVSYLRVMVTRRGLEPRTHGLKGSCSTN